MSSITAEKFLRVFAAKNPSASHIHHSSYSRVCKQQKRKVDLLAQQAINLLFTFCYCPTGENWFQ